MHPGQRLPCAPPPTSPGGGGDSRPLLGQEEDKVVRAAAAEGVKEEAAADEGQRKPPRRWASTRRSVCSQAGQRQRNLRRGGAPGWERRERIFNLSKVTGASGRCGYSPPSVPRKSKDEADALPAKLCTLKTAWRDCCETRVCFSCAA